jgi:hypothetical protein
VAFEAYRLDAVNVEDVVLDALMLDALMLDATILETLTLDPMMLEMVAFEEFMLKAVIDADVVFVTFIVSIDSAETPFCNKDPVKFTSP